MLRRIIRRDASRRRYARLAGLALAAVPCLASSAPASYFSSWLDPVSGRWDDRAKWSTPWAYPNNATNAFSATIAATGSPYTVDFAVPQGVAVEYLDLRSPDATLRHSAGTLTLGRHPAYALRVGGGAHYELSGGTLNLVGHGWSTVGYAGTGTFAHRGGTVLQRTPFVVGSSYGTTATGSGALVMDGLGARWNAIPDDSNPVMAVGVDQGTGALLVTNGASPTLGALAIGATGGEGTLSVAAGARVTAPAMTIGSGFYYGGSPGTGTALVNDHASSITLTGVGLSGDQSTLIVGDSDGVGAGTLRVSAGSIQATGAAVMRTGTLDLSGGRVSLGAGAFVAGSFLLRGTGAALGGHFDLREHGRLDVSGGSFTVSRFDMNFAGTQTFGATGGLLSVGSFSQRTGVSTFAGTAIVSALGMGVSGDARFNLDGAVVSSPSFRVSGGAVNYSSGTFNVSSLAVTGGRFTLAPGANLRLDVHALDVRGQGVLDLNDSRLLIDYTGPSPVSEVRADIARAYAGGAWTGSGITSALANATTQGLGYVDVGGASILVRLTQYGDANLDRVVNLADFNALAEHFGQAGALWSEGDFNYDGVVNLRDFNALAANFGLVAAGARVTPQDWANLAAAVPEPSCGLLVACGLSGLLARQRRRPS